MKQQGIFVTGTDTDVGKTYVGQTLIRALSQRSLCVRVRKPVESGWPIESQIHTTDAVRLSHATTHREALSVICPNTFTAAISPARAATLAGKTLSIARLKQQCFINVTEQDFLYVEGAGGFYSPLTQDGLNADLAQQLGLPLLLVADDKIGCINHVLLTVEAAKQCGLNILAIILNKTNRQHQTVDDPAMNNSDELSSYTCLPIFSYAYHQLFAPPSLLQLMLN